MFRAALPDASPHDPRGLIRESFRMEGIGPEECRSIFFDWALGLPEATDYRTAIEALLREYADADDAHPMKAVLREGLSPRHRGRARPRRRPGRGAA